MEKVRQNYFSSIDPWDKIRSPSGGLVRNASGRWMFSNEASGKFVCNKHESALLFHQFPSPGNS